ncbi:MAG: S-methyl-5'-thioadenosine phosphorylase [Hyphomonas sp. TMED17]|nr:MAG: S-methyl-5'-thioadenosine phosphorylase [Hyphomonas sp. TMED17]
MDNWVIGVIGGSGLYDLQGLQDTETIDLETPWGAPSDRLVKGRIGAISFVFLPRHGKGHRLTPSAVPYRANIDALKRLGCSDIVSISACGSLREAYAPGDFVFVDQFIDRTIHRDNSFFGDGVVAHVSMADPVCRRLSGLVAEAAGPTGVKIHQGGTYLAMEGPQFSSRAESYLYRQWGCDVIGMTNMPEAKVAREAELPYATMAMVTDYDCWREGENGVEVTDVLDIMQKNTAHAQQTLQNLAQQLQAVPRTLSPQGIETCLDFALITAPEARDPDQIAKLDAVAGRVLSPQ